MSVYRFRSYRRALKYQGHKVYPVIALVIQGSSFGAVVVAMVK